MMLETAASNINMNNAVAYIRVSTKEQQEKMSPEYQKKLAIEYVDKYNASIDENLYDGEVKPAKIFLDKSMIFEEPRPASKIYSDNVDNDIWESLDNRPKLKRILELAENKQIAHLILLSRDRMARNFDQFIALSYFFNRNGVKIHYTRSGENLNIEDKKINRFLDNILASVAELEADVISVRVKGGCRISVKNGWWPGSKPPYGYVIEHQNVTNRRPIAKLKPSIYEQSNVLKVFKLYSLGYGYRKIADKMNNECENNAWTKSKVESIIKNETYTGCITYDRRGGRRHPGRHEKHVQSDSIELLSFIEKGEWDEICRFRKYKTELKDPKYFDTPYLLKNKLICGKCGEKLKTKNYGKNKEGKNLCVYRCIKCKDINDKFELVIPKEAIEGEFLESIKKTLKIKIENIEPYWDLYNKELEKQNMQLNEIIEELEKRISTIKSLKENITSIFQDIGKNVDVQYINNILQKDKKDKDLANSIKEKTYNNLIYQQILLSKVEAKYEKEKADYQKRFNNKFCFNKESYKNAINKFILNFDSLDLRRKRILIDLFVDKIIVNESSAGYITNIIMIPSQIIR
jgi:site-specific DNA recombinase